VVFSNVSLFRCSYTMAWQAKSGYVEYYHTIIERMVNAFFPVWFLLFYIGEIFDSLKYYNRRLKAFLLAKGFNIIRKNNSIKINFLYRFSYYYYRTKT